MKTEFRVGIVMPGTLDEAYPRLRRALDELGFEHVVFDVGHNSRKFAEAMVAYSFERSAREREEREIAALLESACERGQIRDDALDEIIHDELSGQASNISNDGFAEQVRFLLSEGYTRQDILAFTDPEED